jgi:hypothetical protein
MPVCNAAAVSGDSAAREAWHMVPPSGMIDVLPVASSQTSWRTMRRNSMPAPLPLRIAAVAAGSGSRAVSVRLESSICNASKGEST